MGIRFGTMFTGTVDRVGGEFIQTKFFAIGVPLIPLGSFFVVREHDRGFPIALNVKSVLWAYIRWLAFIGAVVAAGEMVFGHWRAPIFAVMSGLWVLSTFFTSAPDREMLAKRSVFKAATGVSALPQMLPTDIAQAMLESLLQNPMHSSLAWSYVVASLRARLANDPESERSAERAWSSLGPSPAWS